MDNLIWSRIIWDNRPRYVQLYTYIRQCILEGMLMPNTRLPATRQLAQELKVSRTTVLQAYDHLIAEGYLEGKQGAGTYVRNQVSILRSSEKEHSGRGNIHTKDEEISGRGKVVTQLPEMWRRVGYNLQAFRPGVPALWDFPFQTWFRILSQNAKSLNLDAYGYGDPAGFLPLRTALAEYLALARGVYCQPEQIIIVGGTQQALYLIFQVLLDAGDTVWMEDPGYNGAKEAMALCGVKPIPIPVDEQGMDVGYAFANTAKSKMVYVTPSHQYPIGTVMSLERRLALLEWARANDCWILEDDYDSEYRYSGRPIAALQGIDQHHRVLYLGTFSKVLFPGLRIGYMIVPPELVKPIVRVKSIMDRGNSILEQATLNSFIRNGHFERHLRNMRSLYKERQEILCYWSSKLLEGSISIKKADTGLHVLGYLHQGEGHVVSKLLKQKNVFAPALSGYTLEHHHEQALIFGYAPYNEGQIRKALEVIANTLKTHKADAHR